MLLCLARIRFRNINLSLARSLIKFLEGESILLSSFSTSCGFAQLIPYEDAFLVVLTVSTVRAEVARLRVEVPRRSSKQ